MKINMENDFKKIMAEYSDEQLIKIVTIQRNDYNPLAIEVADLEIKNRNIDLSKIEEVKENLIAKDVKQKEFDSRIVRSYIRFYHFIIDSIAILFFVFILLKVLDIFIDSPTKMITNIIVSFISLITFFTYYIVLEYKYKKTIAKFITKTKVVKDNNQILKLTDILIRTICRLIPFDRFSYLFSKRGIHDYLSQTDIVYDINNESIKNTINSTTFIDVHMESIQTPIQIEGITENIYAGFWQRLGAFLLDTIFMLPILYLTIYINSLDINYFYITFIPNFVISLWYYIYLPKKYGGTPGKLIAGIKIIKLNGQDIDWKEATLRHLILLILGLLSMINMLSIIPDVDYNVFTSLSWLKQSTYLMSLSPIFFKFYTWTSNIWIYSEFIVLLTNKRKRAIHDFIAGTVIVKSKYVDKIKEDMLQKDGNEIIIEDNTL